MSASEFGSSRHRACGVRAKVVMPEKLKSGDPPYLDAVSEARKVSALAPSRFEGGESRRRTPGFFRRRRGVMMSSVCGSDADSSSSSECDRDGAHLHWSLVKAEPQPARIWLDRLIFGGRAVKSR